MKKLAYLSALLLLGVTSCNQMPKDSVFKGIVYDASMNNITLITDQGDTVNISTMDADPTKVPGVLLNDSVEVTCAKEKIESGEEILKAIDLTVTAHSPYFYIQGSWVQPNPINANEEQGFSLNQDGTATSINMATLLFKKWNLDNKTLTLQYESVGNGGTFQGTDTLSVAKINADSLVLEQNGNVIWRLTRKK